MPLNSTRHPTSERIEANRKVLMALKNIQDYAPTNPRYSIASLTELNELLEQAEEAKVRAERDLQVARSQIKDAALVMHEALLGAKLQVLTQYGPDSVQIKMLGLKRKSERKRPTRRSANGS